MGMATTMKPTASITNRHNNDDRDSRRICALSRRYIFFYNFTNNHLPIDYVYGYCKNDMTMTGTRDALTIIS